MQQLVKNVGAHIDRSRPLCMREGETEADVMADTNITRGWLYDKLEQYWESKNENPGNARDLLQFLRTEGVSAASLDKSLVSAFCSS